MWLLLAIVAVPIIEIALFVQIGGHIGVIGTLAWVLLTTALGAVLIRLEPQRSAHDVRAALHHHSNPASPMGHSALRVIGAALIFLPGFFTDTLGFLLLLPPIRHILLLQILHNLKSRHDDQQVTIEGDYEHAPPPQKPRITHPEKRD